MSASEHSLPEVIELQPSLSGAQRLGQKFATAREKLGLSVDDISNAIKIQVYAVRQIELGDFEALGPSVFARGFMRSYAKHVQLGQSWLDAELAAIALDVAPSLLPSRGERQDRSSTAERGMLAASYLVGTAILVSAIFVVTHFDRFVGPQLQQTSTISPQGVIAAESAHAPLSGSASSALPAVSPSDAPLRNASVLGESTSPVVAQTQPADGAPSVLNQPQLVQTGAAVTNAIFASAIPDQVDAVAAGIVALPSLPLDTQALELTVTGTVWVEISDSTGRRLEFNNLASGVRKSYSGKAPFTLKIGNIANASLTAGGKAVDLAPLTNGGSVAKFRLIESGGVLSATTVASTGTGTSELR
jgi:cytoskeleton protein RodZ